MHKKRDDERGKQVALFRYGVISDFVNGFSMSKKQRSRMIREKSARKWEIPYSEKTRISVSTIYKWIRDYKARGCKLESLNPQNRSDQGHSRAMDDDTCDALVELRKQKPDVTVDELMLEMYRKKLVTPGIDLKRSTMYRFLHGNGLMELTGHHPVDRRRFEAELPNDLWQSDVMHGPKVEHEGKHRKAYLIAIIDDHSRLIPYARFYFSETLVSYLDALYHALARRGLPRKLYVDNGAAFRSHKLQYVTAALNITLIHAKPYQPQGKGKIERWFKTIRSMFLPGFDGKTLDDLNSELTKWLDTTYHTRKHGSTGQSPFHRFTQNLHCARSAPSCLMNYFRTVSRRKVNKDRTVVLNGRLFEAPVALIGKRIELLYHDSDPDRVEVRSDHQSFGFLQKVSLHVNCRVKRDRNNNPDIQLKEPRTYSSGSLFGSGRKDK
ncbi:MAG: DDE-type integrase/transposase/recombinase [Methanosarcinaceae archaeon]